MKSVLGPSSSRRIKSLKIRNGRGTVGRADHLDDIPLDLTRDPNDILKEVLVNICSKQGVTTARKLGHLNNLIKLFCNLNDESQIKIPMEVVMCCLKATLVSDVKEVRAAGVRALRYLINSNETKQIFMDLNLDYLITKCLDISHFNEIERIQAIRLVRKLAHLKQKHSNFEPVVPLSLFACIVSVSLGGAEERDRVYRTCLAVLCELAVIQPWLLLRCNGVLAMINAILECHMYHRISECLCMSLMHLINHPTIRKSNTRGLNMGSTFAPFTELNYRLHPDVEDSKLKEEQEMRFNASKMSIVSLLRTWSGLLHVCNSPNMIRSFAEALLIPSPSVRRGIMMVLCDLFYFNELTWTDDFDVALNRAAPGNFKDNWRLSDGFVVAEGKCLLPVRAVARPDLVDSHLAILLLAFLKQGLLKCLTAVALSSDSYSAVAATVILGKILHLSSQLLPSDSSDSWRWHLPHLLSDGMEDLPLEDQLRINVTVKQLQEIHMMETNKTPNCYSLYLTQLIQDLPRDHHCSPRRISVAGLTPSRGRSGSTSSLDPLMSPTTFSIIRRHRTLNLMRDFTEDNTLSAVKNTRVLATKENREWDWEALECLFLSPPSASFLRGVGTDDTLRRFYRRLIYFYLPASKLFSATDLSKDGVPDHNRKFVTTACYMMQFLAHSDEEGQRLLKNLVTAIVESLPEISSEASGYSKSVGSLAVTCSREYFLILGALSCDPRGDQVLGYSKAYHYFLGLASETTHENLVKLMVSSLHYAEDSPSRAVLNKVLTTCNEAGRLYATGFLRVLLRANCPGFQSWGTDLLTNQLFDKSNEVAAEALDILHEACDDREYLHAVVTLRPTLLHLGERGVILVCRFLSDPDGFDYYLHNRYLARELDRWWESYNERYVIHVEELLKLSLTTYERPNKEEGFVRRSGYRKGRQSVYLPAHLYGELCRLEKGVKVVVEEEVAPRLTKILRTMIKEDADRHLLKEGARSKEEEAQRLVKMKSCLWALAHIGSTALGLPLLQGCDCLPLFTKLATESHQASVRGTSIYCINCIAQTIPGVEAIRELGWKSVQRTINKPEPASQRKHSLLFEPEVPPQMTRSDLTKSVSSSWSTASSSSHLTSGRSPRRSNSNVSTSSHGRERLVRSRASSRTGYSESGSSFRKSRRSSKKSLIYEDLPSPTTTTSASTSIISSRSSIFDADLTNSVNSSLNISKSPSLGGVRVEKITSPVESTTSINRRSSSIAEQVVTSQLNTSSTSSKSKLKERVWGTVNHIFKKTKIRSTSKGGIISDRKKQTDETSSGYVSDHHPFEHPDFPNVERSLIEENETPPSPRPSPPNRRLLSSGTLTSSSNASVDTLKIEVTEAAFKRKSSEYSLKTELSVTPGNVTSELSNVSSWNRNNSGQVESVIVENGVARERTTSRFYVAESDYAKPGDGDKERYKRSKSLPDVLEAELSTTALSSGVNESPLPKKDSIQDYMKNCLDVSDDKPTLPHSQSDGNIKSRQYLDLPFQSRKADQPNSEGYVDSELDPVPDCAKTNPDLSDDMPKSPRRENEKRTFDWRRSRGNTEVSTDSGFRADLSSDGLAMSVTKDEEKVKVESSLWHRSKPKGLAAVRIFTQQLSSPSAETRRPSSDQSESSSDEITVEERDDIISTTRFVGIAVPDELSSIFQPLYNESGKERETLSSILSTWKDPADEETPAEKNPGKQKVIDLLQGRKFRGLDEYTFGPAVAAALKANKPGRSHSTMNTPCARTPDSMLSEASDLCYLGGQSMEPGSDEYVAILHEEIIQLVVNLGSSVGIKAHETALLMMKEKKPEVFDSVSLYNSIVQIMSEYSFRLTTRRFVQELFQDVHFTEVYLEAQKALQGIK